MRSRVLIPTAAAALLAAAALSSSALGPFDHVVRALLLLPQDAGQQELEAVRDLTAVGSFPIIVGAAVIAGAMFWANRRRRDAIILAITLAVATAANLGLKLMFAKPRPPADESHIAVFTLSYPSGHALMTGVLAGALALLATTSGTTARRVALACAVLTTLLVGLSRIRLGAHWPTDVLAGWLTALALTSALAAWLERAR